MSSQIQKIGVADHQRWIGIIHINCLDYLNQDFVARWNDINAKKLYYGPQNKCAFDAQSNFDEHSNKEKEIERKIRENLVLDYNYAQL